MLLDLSNLKDEDWKFVQTDLITDTTQYKTFLAACLKYYQKIVSNTTYEYRPYQPEFAALYACRKRNVCNVDMGLAKTSIMILMMLVIYKDFSNRKPGTVQVIADNIFATRFCWLKDFKNAGLDKYCSIIKSEDDLVNNKKPIWIYHRDFLKRKSRTLKHRRHCLLVDLVIKTRRPSLLVIDEVHNCLGKSLRASSVDKLTRYSKRVSVLSGTISDGDLKKIYEVLKLVYRSEINFTAGSLLRKYGSLRRLKSNYKTGLEEQDIEFNPEYEDRYLPSISASALPDYSKFICKYIHRASLSDPNIKSVCTFPVLTEEQRPVDLQPTHREIYSYFLRTNLEEIRSIVNYSSHHQSGVRAQQLSRYLMVASLNTWALPTCKVTPSKYFEALKIVEHQLKLGKKVVFFSDMISASRNLYNELKKDLPSVGILRIYAQDKQEYPKTLSHQERLDRFQKILYDPNYKIGVFSVRLLNTSIDLSSVGCLIYWDIPWQSLLVEQSLKRVHRPGSLYKQVGVYYPTHNQTIDEHQYHLFALKREGRNLIQDFIIPSRQSADELSLTPINTLREVLKHHGEFSS